MAILRAGMFVLVFAGATLGQISFVEDWDTTPTVPNDLRGWSFGFGDSVNPAGGNPDGYLNAAGLDTFAPSPSTDPGLVNTYVGDVDYAALEVTSIGVDVIVNAVGFSAAERPLTLFLINDNGSPNDLGDDIGVSFTGTDLIPEPGEGWRSFDFDIPSTSPTLPDGWVLRDFSGATPAFDWLDVIGDVDRVEFFYGDPEFFFIFQVWDTGIDNFRFNAAVPEPATFVMLAGLGCFALTRRRGQG